MVDIRDLNMQQKVGMEIPLASVKERKGSEEVQSEEWHTHTVMGNRNGVLAKGGHVVDFRVILRATGKL